MYVSQSDIELVLEQYNIHIVLGKLNLLINVFEKSVLSYNI